MKKIVLLGSTGSVGGNTLEVVKHHRDEFELVGLAGGGNVARLGSQCDLFPGSLCAVGTEDAYRRLTSMGADYGRRCVGYGEEAMERLILETSPDLVVNCLVGFVGLRPTLAAVEAGIPVATANKEAIVAGGEILKTKAGEKKVPLIPIDSEHVAISQCLRGRSMEEVRKVYITASGGALREKPLGEIGKAGVEDVLRHPTWNMGEKITVDSATMINKGLEVMEAHWLFDLPYRKIDVVIHPQSIVHSLVEFEDGSIIAQMGVPDMRLPILHALSYPDMIASDLANSRITDFPDLSFSEPEPGRYPCFELALQAAKRGGNSPTVLNSANEEAVGAFLAGRLKFRQIPEVIADALERVEQRDLHGLEDIFRSDREAREIARMKIGSLNN